MGGRVSDDHKWSLRRTKSDRWGSEARKKIPPHQSFSRQVGCTHGVGLLACPPSPLKDKAKTKIWTPQWTELGPWTLPNRGSGHCVDDVRPDAKDAVPWGSGDAGIAGGKRLTAS